MSRAESAERILTSAASLGIRSGVGALSLQAIATAANVSKALVLYHFKGKGQVLNALSAMLADSSSKRLAQSLMATDAMDGWRALVRDEVRAGELVLLSALSLESEVEPGPLLTWRGERERAAAQLTTRILDSLSLSPRVPTEFLGRLLLRQLDGVAMTAALGGLSHGELDSEMDAFALALIALGR